MFYIVLLQFALTEIVVFIEYIGMLCYNNSTYTVTEKNIVTEKYNGFIGHSVCQNKIIYFENMEVGYE